jgi:UDP-2,4-diacetamido-2,4,6-trideoxy-beta-L-altropyranose hydrolase
LSTVESAISLRPATISDREMVFCWRNDPFIVARGSFLREVGWEEHKAWFDEVIAEDKRRMFIVRDQSNPIGQIRFDRVNRQECVVSVYLLEAFTGRGYGVQAIRMGCAAIFEAWDAERVIACVRLDNPGGRSAFLKAGFGQTNRTTLCPGNHYSLALSRRTNKLR